MGASGHDSADDLERLLDRVNRARRRGGDPGGESLERTAEERYGASRHLAVYGSLAPGESNHRLLADLAGTWRDGWVRGRLLDRGWSGGNGYPLLRLDRDGERVAVKLFESDGLDARWDALDAFEGPGYRRQLVAVFAEARMIAVANVYGEPR